MDLESASPTDTPQATTAADTSKAEEEAAEIEFEPSSHMSANPELMKSQFSYIDEYSEKISQSERESEEERMKEARKDSQLQSYLLELRRKQIKLQMFQDQIKKTYEPRMYNRRTNLDKPIDEFEVLPFYEEESKDEYRGSGYRSGIKQQRNNGEKLSKEEKIDDQEIKSQFIPCSEEDNYQQTLEMAIDDDIARLCKMYLENLTTLKNALPSENVEHRHYLKLIQTQQQQNTPNQANMRNSLRQGDARESLVDRSSISQSNNLSRSLRGGSIANAMSVQGSFSQSQPQNLHRSQTVGRDKYVPRDDLFIMQPCIPQLHRIDKVQAIDQKEKAQLWSQFVQELRQNPYVMAEIVQKVMTEGSSYLSVETEVDSKVFDQAHSTMLVNLSQFFFDPIHLEERHAFHWNSHFLRFFMIFADQHIQKEQFMKDPLKNVTIQHDELKATIQCLFEGLTRRLPAFNFLRFVYQSPFNRVQLFSMEQDLRKKQKKDAELLRQQAEKISQKQQEQKKVVQEDKKKNEGFFNKLKSIFSSDKDTKKEVSKNPLPEEKPKDGSQSARQRPSTATPQRSAPLIQGPLFHSLAMIYGQPADPFSSCPVLTDDPQQLYRRYDEIEERIRKNSQNNCKFLMNDFGYQATAHLQIEMNEQKVRELVTQTRGNEQQEESKNNVKDLTYYIKTLVQKSFEQMLNFGIKIPFVIKAMLKILLIKSRGGKDFNIKLKPNASEIHLMAEILIASWLNIGYRNPKCFGIQPSVEKELELEYIFFQAARITFEHMMLIMKIPDTVKVIGFDIAEINKFIEQMSSQVFIFWTRLVNVDISEVMKPVRAEIIESNMLRIDDMELLFIYADKVNQEYPNYTKSLSGDRLASWQRFQSIFTKLKEKVGPLEVNENLSQEKQFIPRNSTGLTLSTHFTQMLNKQDFPATEWWPYEYYYLFIKQKTDDQIGKDLKVWNQETLTEIKQFNKEFVIKELAISVSDCPSPIEVNVGIKRQNSLAAQPQDRINSLPSQLSKSSDLSTRGSHQQMNHLSGTRLPIDTRAVRLHKFQNNDLSVSQVETMLFNIFNSLRVLLDQNQLLLEVLKDQTCEEEQKCLVHLLQMADLQNKKSEKPSTKISVGCQHIIRMLRLMNLEGNFYLQNQIMQHFISLIEQKIKNSRNFLDQSIIAQDILSVDVERFEANITSMKSFHTKYENSLKFMKTISRYNPEVCFLECFNFDLTEEWRSYKGLLLNMSCSHHQTSLPMCAYMLFGGMTRRGDFGNGTPEEQNENFQALELPIRKIREARVKRFREYHFAHTTFTVSLQNSHNGLAPTDEQIRLIEDMIEYYCDRKIGSHYVKVLVRGGEEKYKHLLSRNSVTLPENLQNSTDKKKMEYIRSCEPLDYMNLVKTYTMFLQHISVLSSTSLNDSYVDEVTDKDLQIKQHYDFLMCDLPAKALRYQIHDYIMKRIHKTIFQGNKSNTMDDLVQKLIISKQDDPSWLLTSPTSQKLVKEGKPVEDFTKQPEWCDPFIYSASLKTLLRVADEPTPHMKAMYIHEAIQQAVNAMRIATPYLKLDEVSGAAQLQRVTKHLMLEVCKIYDKAQTNPRLYSQLLYILLFNVPQNEQVMYSLIRQQIQESNKDSDTVADFSKLSQPKQHSLYLSRVGSRYSVYEWFLQIQGLIQEHIEKTNPEQTII